MVEDHRPTIAELVWEFYANLHRRAGDSFLTWVRGTEIHVTPDLISAIIRVPRGRDSECHGCPTRSTPSQLTTSRLVLKWSHVL
jgi:hypothetical protein